MKQKIVPIAIIALLASLGVWKYYDYKHPHPQTAEVTQTTQQVPVATDGTQTRTTTVPSSPSINIQRDVPINGKLKGVIEVGASGFNSFVANIDADKNWELVSKEFGTSMMYEGFGTVEDVKQGMRKYMSNMFDKGVNGHSVFFVMSSGALKNPKTEMIAKGIEASGYIVNRVNAEQEGKYAARALLSKTYRPNSFVVDIGSGNTKISWFDAQFKAHSIECSGAKYYENGKTDQDVYNEVLAAAKQVPEANRNQCFIIGGVPYELAKKGRNGDERFTQLKGPDEYSAGDNVKIRSGLNIYRAIEDASKCNTFVFDWDANFTIGFLLTLN